MKLADGIIFYTEDEVQRYLTLKQRKEFRPIVGLNNLIKIDVQGYELQVLEGISKQIYKKIKWIYSQRYNDA